MLNDKIYWMKSAGGQQRRGASSGARPFDHVARELDGTRARDQHHISRRCPPLQSLSALHEQCQRLFRNVWLKKKKKFLIVYPRAVFCLFLSFFLSFSHWHSIIDTLAIWKVYCSVLRYFISDLFLSFDVLYMQTLDYALDVARLE